eukprot:m.162478 g.162478  ORF g.162478 m.162478 type:complete len:61 (+) comp18070_c0_seq2:1028-1210(+)
MYVNTDGLYANLCSYQYAWECMYVAAYSCKCMSTTLQDSVGKCQRRKQTSAKGISQQAAC